MRGSSQTTKIIVPMKRNNMICFSLLDEEFDNDLDGGCILPGSKDDPGKRDRYRPDVCLPEVVRRTGRTTERMITSFSLLLNLTIKPLLIGCGDKQRRFSARFSSTFLRYQTKAKFSTVMANTGNPS